MGIVHEKRNFEIADSGDLLRIVVAHAPDWLELIRDGVLIVIILLISVDFAMHFAIGNLDGQSSVSITNIVLVAVVWVVGATVAATNLLWQLTGQEELEVTSDDIVLCHRFAGMRFTLRFEANRIGAVFVSREHRILYLGPKGYGMSFLDFRDGKVAINTGRNLFGVVTHRFGTSLLPNEARRIVELIHQKFPKFAHGPTHKAPVPPN